jgi:divalent metal cation (Fe/Co/Zn/Cd) transporter
VKISPIPKGVRHGLTLEYITLGWNVIGVCIVLYAATKAGSIALAGFGIDSFIEILASAVVVWQLKGFEDNREALSLKIIAVAFVLLATYITLQIVRSLIEHDLPRPSLVGVIWLSFTFIAMILLAQGKAKIGKQIKNAVLITEGKVTQIDAYLAGAVLIGISLNGLFSWWWADPIASLVIIYYGIRESFHAWNEAKELSAHNTTTS